MRAKHAEARAKILKSHAETVTSLADKMTAALKAQESELTKAGKIDDALAAKHMRESLEKDEGVAAASDFLAAASSKSSKTAWRSLLKEPMQVTQKGAWDICVLSEIQPQHKILTPFAVNLKALRETPDRILMSHAPGVVEFKTNQHATQIKGEAYLANPGGSVRFTIHADRKLVFEKSIEGEAKSIPFDVTFEQAKTLTLSIDPLGSETHDWGVWLAPEIR
jgi:hypothetical protein